MNLETIQHQIFEIRGVKVMRDSDLAKLYRVETKRLKEAVKRNRSRFPIDFMFELTHEEVKFLRSQNASSSWGGSRYKPYVFTEQGIAMLSGVLNSETAVNVNISIMRAFVCMRKFALSHTELTRKLEYLEVMVDQKFTDVYKALEYLIDKNFKDINQSKRKRIGFKPDN